MNNPAKKSIVFIEPAGTEASVFEDYMRLPLMGSLYLGTILSNHGHDVRVYNECILRRRVDPFSLSADIFLITSLTVTASRAKLLAGQIREIYPDAKVIMGGIHASLRPEDFADVADHIVCGEAEDIIVDVVEGKYEEKIIQGKMVSDVNDLPLVDYTLLEGIETVDIIPIMTSRGCPFDCNFCTVTKIFGRKFRMQTPERMIAEVENALTQFKTRDVFFYDDNFTANKKRVNEFCDLILEKGIDITWTAQVRSDIAKDPDLVRKMSRAGCHCFYIGFESIDDATLKAMHKSQTREDIENSIRTIHEQGVNIHGMFIFGNDNDSAETIHATVDFAIEQDIDTVQFMILTPFPGTETYDTIVSEKRLFHQRWDYFNGMYIVFQPKAMGATQLQLETLAAYRKFYSLRRAAMHATTLVSNVFVDALTWDFSRVFRYGFDTLFLRAGAKFLVGKYGETLDTYLTFLNGIERSRH